MFADTIASSPSPFSPAQIKASCFAMLDVAHANGISPAELELIRGFWASSEEPLGQLEENSTKPFAAELFTSDEHKQLLIDLCLACAFADGQYSSEEKAVLGTIAARVGVSDQALEARTAEVRAQFLGALAHLPDAQSVAALAKDLE